MQRPNPLKSFRLLIVTRKGYSDELFSCSPRKGNTKLQIAPLNFGWFWSQLIYKFASKKLDTYQDILHSFKHHLWGWGGKIKKWPNIVRHYFIGVVIYQLKFWNWNQTEVTKLVYYSVGIFPGTFSIFKSRDFWTSLVPGQQDHGTFKVSRSCPV